MLTYATLLLELTLTGDTVSSDGSLSTNITSTCHDYIHLVLDVNAGKGSAHSKNRSM